MHLNAEGKSPKTVRTYVEAVQWFAAAQLVPAGGRGDWSAVTAEDVKVWLVRLLDTYSDSYANNQFRALQQFFKWNAEDEDVPTRWRGSSRRRSGRRSSPSSPTRS